MLQKISLPFQLLLVLIVVTLCGNQLNTTTINFFYSLSLLFKECLSFLLPWIIFSFITTGILGFRKNAPVALSIILYCTIFSNALVAFFAYFVGTTWLPFFSAPLDLNTVVQTKSLVPLWAFHIPSIIPSDKAMVAAVFSGIILSSISIPFLEKMITQFKTMIEYIINTIFIPILPLYVFGFLLEINHQGIFLQLFQTYGKTFSLILIVQFMVLWIIYLIAAGCNNHQAMRYVTVAIPSYITAFGTMSSTATIPITVRCAEHNTGNKHIAAMATPILANIHLVGDAISVPILALATLYIFQGTMPDIHTYTTFVGYFCMNMLAVAGIPGGGIIVMIPILKTILGFNDGMISIMTTLYFLQDGLGTAANVMGDGALIIIINKLLQRLKIN